MRRRCLAVVGVVLAAGLGWAPSAFACGGLVAPNGAVKLLNTATLVARASGLEDPQFVVIDEVAGQLVALIAVPLAWKTFLAGFILFRIFDMWKPFPIRRLERLPEGTGIVVDDLGAGVYALTVMHLLLHFRLLKT